MKSVRTSLVDVNRPHSLVAGPMAGLMAVALIALFVPSGLEMVQAWGIFVAIGAGTGLGRLLDERRRGSAEASPT